MRAQRLRMQMIYQDPYDALGARDRVRAIVEEPLLIHRVCSSTAERAELVTAALARAGLTPPDLYLDRYPHELSGGQLQRVAIAASIVLGPRLLIADEPFSMLDVSTKAAVLSLLDDLRRDGELGVLMITHDLLTAGRFADRILVMYLGRIVEEATAHTILRGETPDPMHVPAGCRFQPRCPSAQVRCREVDPALHRPNGAAAGHRAACILL